MSAESFLSYLSGMIVTYQDVGRFGCCGGRAGDGESDGGDGELHDAGCVIEIQLSWELVSTKWKTGRRREIYSLEN